MTGRACVAAMLSIGLTIAGVPVSAAAPTHDAADVSAVAADVSYVRCESGFMGRYKECAAKTEGRVELVRELSRGRCQQWKSWGFDRDGVWVDNGCRAEFRVGKDGGGPGAGTAVAVGAVAGAAILAAILANKGKESSPEAIGAPEWARGRFTGFSPKLDEEFDVTIDRDGNAKGTAGGKPVTGFITAKSNDLHLGELEFQLTRESWGFAAKQKNDAENVIYFRRQ